MLVHRGSKPVPASLVKQSSAGDIIEAHRHADLQPVNAVRSLVFNTTGPGAKQLQSCTSAAACNCLLRVTIRGVEWLCWIGENEDDFPTLKLEFQRHSVVGAQAAVVVQIGDDLFDHDH